MAGTALGGMPGQGLINVVAQKIQHIYPKRAMLNQLSGRSNVLQVPDEHEFEEHYGVNRRVPCFSIELFCMLIQESQVERFLQPPIEVLFRNAAGESKRGK